ncbi:MAG: 1-acylglycerol-3-phosphate O-acyltransferase [Bdellovibrionota bacterium]|nr:1-acylglycerol-3-phosphate O-acyltransferase [Bdellovibrionota bacterium]
MLLIKYFKLFVAGLFLLITGPFALLFCCLKPSDPSNLLPVSRFIGHGWRKIFRFKLKVLNEENFETGGNFVVISNHQSNLDIIVCGLTLPKRTVAIGKKSLKWIPLFGQIFWLSGNILLDRKKKVKAKQMLQETVQMMIEKNVSIWIMPEGTRNHGKGILPFKKGPFFTAIAAQVPIIPVCISSLDRFVNIGKWDAGQVLVKVLSPIPTKGMTEKDVPHMAALCQHIIREGVDKVNEELLEMMAKS